MSLPCSTRTMNLGHLLDQTARRLPDHPAMIWGERRWSWAQMRARVDAMARLLAARGVGKGDRVLVQSPNNNQMWESLWACLKLGAIWVPANFRGAPDDLRWMVELAQPKLLICHADYPDHADMGLPVLAIGQAGFGPDIDEALAAQSDAPLRAADVERDDPAWLFFTSGSTGKPKAAVLTHGQMGFVIANHLADLIPGTGERDASLVVAPLSHGAGIHQMLQVARGAVTILPEKGFDPAEIWRLIQTHRVSNMFTVPTIVKLLTEDPAVDRFDHSSLRHVIYAGAPMYRADQIRALEKLGPVLVQYFGLGEVTGCITVLPARLHETGEGWALEGSCGYPRTGIQVEIQDEAGNPLPPGETGELCVTGGAVFAGYWNNPEANAKSFRNGWFRTGDLGHMDERGFFYLTGRESDMYISGGSNIHPREIEEKLLLHPDIAECAVLGMPDPKWGEIGVAICVTRGGARPDLEAWLGPKIARYKLPKRFLFWEALPKSGYGKITKKLVREELIRRDEEAANG
ncbi:acyl-CoA synthetase [Paracoccus alkanivorans]|uniref:Acyl-CoA synthetase n=1 Tax=Paracoccus alkanivorans TaxID=2116655 RepID=A0A3M0M3X3_9RHOB|nr:acyl-CoA synthetase [Paracoccus alkanivorans]RMC32458.1 acyl-CoA synthetase [Paracoccus alkanivorans]